MLAHSCSAFHQAFQQPSTITCPIPSTQLPMRIVPSSHACVRAMQAATAPMLAQDVVRLPDGSLEVTAYCPYGSFRGVLVEASKFVPSRA